MGKFRLFGRSRNNSGLREASNEEHLSFITHSSNAVGWGTVEHAEPDSWTAYMSGFHQEVSDYMDRTHPDIYNGRCMDDQIRRHQELAVTEAGHCRVRNQRSIHNIRTYQNACLHELDLAIAQMEEELNRCQEEGSKC